MWTHLAQNFHGSRTLTRNAGIEMPDSALRVCVCVCVWGGGM